MYNFIENLGQQKKFIKGEYYYKIDENGYPSLSEYIVSHLLKYSNIKEYVLYDVEVINNNGENKLACKSKNFLKDGEKVITLQELYNSVFNKSIEEDIIKIIDIHDRIKFVVDFVENRTKIINFGEYLTLLLQIDKLFLNDDRHFDNIALIRYDKSEYRLCPVFDNGAMLLSSTIMYNLDDTIENNMKKFFALPFSLFLEEQANAAISLYGDNFIIKYDKDIIDSLLGNVENLYSDIVINRVRGLLYNTI